MIEFNQVTLLRGVQTLLDGASLRIHDGQKLALIGANGAGKSSLFALLNGELSLDGGDLLLPSKWRKASTDVRVRELLYRLRRKSNPLLKRSPIG